VSTLPAGQGWSGAGVWGSQPSIDPVRKQIFIGTGNIYTYPIEFLHCKNDTASCLPDGVWQDSIVALDLNTGKVNWRRTITPLDGWVQACGYPGAPTSQSPLCPESPGPDADFGMAPTFVPAALGDGTTGNDSVVVGQKSGNVFNLNAVTGDVQWIVAAGGDSTGSWLSWGIAIDRTSVYFTIINYGSKNWTLKPSGVSINNSAWGSLSLKTGDYAWETPVPDNLLAYAPPGLVNDVVFVGQSGGATTQISGAVFALSKDQGKILHRIPVEGVQNGGIMAKGGFVMFGTGYSFRNPFNRGSFYVFALPGAVDKAKADIASKLGSTASSSASPSGTRKAGAASRLGGGGMLTAVYPILFLVLCFFAR
jgi:hypothetical protein